MAIVTITLYHFYENRTVNMIFKDISMKILLIQKKIVFLLPYYLNIFLFFLKKKYIFKIDYQKDMSFEK